jgi:hypothetical protein
MPIPMVSLSTASAEHPVDRNVPERDDQVGVDVFQLTTPEERMEPAIIVIIDAQRTHPLAPDAFNFAKTLFTQWTYRTGKFHFANVSVVFSNSDLPLFSLCTIQG